MGMASRVLIMLWFLLVLVWAGLHAFILPRIVDNQTWLQQQVSKAVGMRVELGGLQVAGGWWLPWLEVTDVRLMDMQGREALRLNNVTLAFSPMSLLRGGFEQVLIDKPELQMHRDEQGHLWVAGLDMANTQTNVETADWFFSQNEFAIRRGRLLWRDELQHGTNAPVLALENVNISVTNRWHQHHFQIDATPPADVGERWSLRGQLEQPWLARAGDWRQWHGQLFAELPYADLSHIRPWWPAEQALSLHEGRGAMRAWVDIAQGQPIGVVTDVRLDAVNVQLGAGLKPLRLKQVDGRLGVQWPNHTFEVSGQDLTFETFDGERWPGGDVRVSWQGEHANVGSIEADRLDLDAMSQVSQRFPLPDKLRAALLALKPQGQVNKLQVSWQIPADANPQEWASQLHFVAKGQIKQFSLQHSVADNTVWTHWPGLENANVDFDMNQQGGKAKLSIQKGSLTLPMGLDEPRIALDNASAQMGWRQSSEGLQIQVSQASASNADATGEFSGQWTSGPHDKPLPGMLDLTANLSRAKANTVYRYLPNTLSPVVRDYVQQAVLQGEGSKIKLRLRGHLEDMPFVDPKQGEFRVVAQVNKGVFAYVPQAEKSLSQGQRNWPNLENIDGELVFDRSSLQFKGKTHLTHAPHVGWSKVMVNVPDLREPVVHVTGESNGPLREVLATVNNSALGTLIDGTLEKAQATGEADYALALTIPVRQLDKTQVKGRVQFKDNDLQVIPGTPVLTRAKGELQYSHEGFQIKELKAKLLGGDAEVKGGLMLSGANADSPLQLKINGNLTAEGLRQARELGFVSRLAGNAIGRADYQATVGIKRGYPELLITSDLKGVALTLPAPFNKTANASWPLRVETQLSKESQLPKSKLKQDQLRVSVGKLFNAVYVRDVSQSNAKVLSGAVQVGLAESAVARDSGVGLNLVSSYLDADAWSSVLSQWTGVPVGIIRPAAKRGAKTPATVVGIGAETANALDYVPTVLAIRAEQLKITDRVLHQVMLGGTRVGELWRLNANAQELNGSIELRPAVANTPAQLYARLSYLNIPPSLIADVENMLSQQPSSIPALDVVVSELTLRGKKLGRLEIEAVNQAGATAASREWRLNKFNLLVPEATFTAKGDWVADGPNLRRTHLNFVMDVRDSGQLLARMGTPNAVRDGRGKVQGQLTWRGSPIMLDYATMSGQINLNIEKGQFLKTEPGAARLLGVLNLQSLPRRLSLDFSDVFSEGFAFDFFRGDARIDQGVAFTNNLQMKGLAVGALIEGRADIARETQDLRVVVVPDINTSAASLYMATINPLVGLTSYLAQMVLNKPLVKASTTQFHIDGSWTQPRVTQVDR